MMKNLKRLIYWRIYIYVYRSYDHYIMFQDMEKEIRKEVDDAIAKAKVATISEIIVFNTFFFKYI